METHPLVHFATFGLTVFGIWALSAVLFGPAGAAAGLVIGFVAACYLWSKRQI